MASSARIDELRKKFEENPRRYFAPLANEYRKAGDIDQAIAICREYLPQQPGHMSGHIVYGQALYESRQFEEGKTVFETALTLDPENLIALRHLGDIALILGDAAGARTWYGRVLEADPRNEEIQAQLQSLDSLSPSAPGGTPSEPGTSAEAGGEPHPEVPTAKTAETPVAGLMAVPPPASAAATVVVSAVRPPATERTVEQPAHPSAPPPESLSTVPTTEIVLEDLTPASAPTTEIVLEAVPQPSVPDIEKLVDAPAETSAAPTEMALGFEPTGAQDIAEQPRPARTLELDSPVLGGAAPPIDSFTLDGLETTSMMTGTPPESAPPPNDAAVDLELALPPSNEPTPQPAEAAAETPGAPAAEIAGEQAAETTSEPSLASEPVFIDLGPSSEEAGRAEPGRDEPQPEHVAEGGSATAGVTTGDSAAAAAPAGGESSPFVTETMAELYLQQGHRDAALRVYRALLEQRPGEASLRARIEAIEQGKGPTIRELLSRVASRKPQGMPRPAEDAAVEHNGAEAHIAGPDLDVRAGTPVETPIGMPLESPANAHQDEEAPAAAAPPAPAPGAVPESFARAARFDRDALAPMFDDAPVADADESAALVLAAAFAPDGDAGARRNGAGDGTAPLPGAPARPASKDLSLDTVFGTGSAPPAPSSFSFDEFFSERATADQPAPGAAAGGQESRDDIAKFTQWLEGLKQR